VRSPVAERFWLVSAVVEKRAKVQPRDRLFGHLCTKPQTAVTTRAWFCSCFGRFVSCALRRSVWRMVVSWIIYMGLFLIWCHFMAWVMGLEMDEIAVSSESDEGENTW
jgi:hypothetical protein